MIIVLLTIITILYIRSSELFHLLTGSLYLLTNNSPFPPVAPPPHPLVPSNHHSILLLLWVWLFYFYFIYLINLFIFCFILGLHPQHMEVPRLGVRSELQLPACTTVTATGDPGCTCDSHHRPQLTATPTVNPLGESRDRIHNRMVPSRIP